MAECRIALEHHKKRVRLLEAYAQRIDLDAQAAATAKSVSEKREAVVQCQKLAAEHALVVPPRKEAVKTADEAHLIAEKATKDAQAALERQRKIEASVCAAFTATDEARLQLPDDSTLIEAAEKLKAKAEELRSVSESLKLKADVALATGKKQADALAAANRQLEESMAETSRLEKAIAAAQATHADEETRAKAIAAEITAATDHLTTLLSDDFQIAQLKPLSPEQMCWSILNVTGVYDRTRKAEEADLDKSKPLAAEVKNDPALVRNRAVELEDRTFAKLKGNVAAFVRIYGPPPASHRTTSSRPRTRPCSSPTPASSTAGSAPAAGNVADRIIRETDPRKAAEDST